MLNMDFIYTLLDCVHVLIAGVTGSGKSTLINAIMYTIITHFTPEDCGLVLIDPKKVGFRKFRRLPHVLHYAEDTAGAIDILHRVYDLMEERNNAIPEWDNFSSEKPVFVIIDELADLMLNGGKEFQNMLQVLLQKCRSANIHIIAATQQPSARCLPSPLRDNFTARVALRCQTAVQSRQILNFKGAEQLEGVGSALYVTDAHKSPVLVSVPCIPETRLKTAVMACMISADTEHKETAAKPSAAAQKPREGSSETEETSSKSLVLSLVQMLVSVIYWLSGLFCKETVSREKKTSRKPVKAFLYVLRMAARLLAIALEATAHVLLFPWYVLECIACPGVCRV